MFFQAARREDGALASNKSSPARWAHGPDAADVVGFASRRGSPKAMSGAPRPTTPPRTVTGAPSPRTPPKTVFGTPPTTPPKTMSGAPRTSRVTIEMVNARMAKMRKKDPSGYRRMLSQCRGDEKKMARQLKLEMIKQAETTTPEKPERSTSRTNILMKTKTKFRLIPRDVPITQKAPKQSTGASPKANVLVEKESVKNPIVFVSEIGSIEVGVQSLNTDIRSTLQTDFSFTQRTAMEILNDYGTDYSRSPSSNDWAPKPAEDEPSRSRSATTVMSKTDKSRAEYNRELQKKFRAVIRKSGNGVQVHVHDLKLCVDLLLMETQNHPDHGLRTDNVDRALDEQSFVGGKQLLLSPECLMELKSWRTFFRKANRKSAKEDNQNTNTLNTSLPFAKTISMKNHLSPFCTAEMQQKNFQHNRVVQSRPAGEFIPGAKMHNCAWY